MNLVKYIVCLLMAVGLLACGGGGGNASGSSSGSSGSSSSGSSSSGSTVAAPSMALTFVDAAGAEIANHALSQTQVQYLKIVLKTAAGAAAPYIPVAVTFDVATAVLVPAVSRQLTDSSGVLLVRVAPSSVSSAGVATATATATIEAISLTKTVDLQMVSGTVTLANLTVSSTLVQQGQSINVGVDVLVNGAAATSNSVSVAFSSACGTATPTTALVDGTGKASAVIQTNSTGICTVNASAAGAVSAPTSFTVTSPPIAGIVFVSAAPTLIYQSGSAGVNTSVVQFKVVDSVGSVVTTGVVVDASLTNTDGGLNFCGSPSSSTSGSDGLVTFSVCGGTLPATVQVHAALHDTPTIFTNSNLLTVQTGMATQRFFDISATKLNFYAGGYFTSQFNGNTTDISVFAADRQGNPVPDGTKIIFVSEGGQINSGGLSSCLISGGKCTVSLMGQDYRPMGSSAAGGDPRPGRVTVLAYTDGEEYFIDKPDVNGNYNNRYDTGELFEDLGKPYIDKDESGVFVSAYTNLVTGTDEGETFYPLPTDASGSSECPANSNVGLSVAGTCNGVWNGYTKVRRTMLIVFSGGEIGQPGDYNATIPLNKRTQLLLPADGYEYSRTSVAVRLADLDGNPLPADAALSTAMIPSSSFCKVTGLGSVIGNTTEPTIHSVSLDGCASGEVIRFKVSVTAGSGTKITNFDVTVP